MSNSFNGPIWEGIYKDFDELESEGRGFESSTWIEHSFEKAKKMRELSRDSRESMEDISFNGSPLYVLASIMYAQNNRLSVLDFGGGMGFGYIVMEAVIPESDNLDFDIVEGANNCKGGKKLFFDDKRVNFFEQLPEDKRYDILHIGSSLQYIHQWKDLLKALCSYEAKYFAFTDLPSGENERYASLQNYYDSKIPHWFFNTKEVIGVMNTFGYKIIYNSHFQANILQRFNHYPQDNFDESSRIFYSKMLLFVKKDI